MFSTVLTVQSSHPSSSFDMSAKGLQMPKEGSITLETVSYSVAAENRDGCFPHKNKNCSALLLQSSHDVSSYHNEFYSSWTEMTTNGIFVTPTCLHYNTVMIAWIVMGKIVAISVPFSSTDASEKYTSTSSVHSDPTEFVFFPFCFLNIQTCDL